MIRDWHFDMAREVISGKSLESVGRDYGGYTKEGVRYKLVGVLQVVDPQMCRMYHRCGLQALRVPSVARKLLAKLERVEHGITGGVTLLVKGIRLELDTHYTVSKDQGLIHFTDDGMKRLKELQDEKADSLGDRRVVCECHYSR